MQKFSAHTPPPRWSPETRLAPDERRRYESWLPVTDFLDDLRRLAIGILPSPVWLPSTLRHRPWADAHAPPLPPYQSLPDLWNELPPSLAGKVTFAADEIPRLLCALADPPRHGTDFGRYPEQLKFLTENGLPLNSAGRAAGLRLLDIGCGTGQGTVETAGFLAKRLGTKVRAVGLTIEPLAAWMAAKRHLPHDPVRSKKLEQFESHPLAAVSFLAGSATCLPFAPASFDLVVANGLVGGPVFADEGLWRQFLDDLEITLSPQGLVLCANSFHEGHLRQIGDFSSLARRKGWLVDGDAANLRLRKALIAKSNVNATGQGAPCRTRPGSAIRKPPLPLTSAIDG